MAPLAKIPAVGLLYKNSVVNATGKNAILTMVAKYSIHRSTEFISDVVFDRTRSRRDKSYHPCSRATKFARVKRPRNNSALNLPLQS